MSSSDLPEHVARNRAAWDVFAADWVESGRRAWASDVPSWGIWSIPESLLRAVPPVPGRDVVELGCGTAYWSARLARRGARVVGIDNSERQLESARELQRERGLDFPLPHGNAETVPYADRSFDIVVSEYGASLWCDLYVWIPEAARLLRSGGSLVFLTNSVLATLCAPDLGDVSEGLERPQFPMHRFEWRDDRREP